MKQESPEGHESGNTIPSLRERILRARSEQEIQELLDLGTGWQYRFATARTRGRWRSAARLQRKRIRSGILLEEIIEAQANETEVVTEMASE